MADLGFDDPTPWDVTPCATVAFIGDDLWLAGTAAAQQRGYKAVLSDVDVLNRPMGNAMERCGHSSDKRPWHHVWFFRSELG